MIGTDLAGAKAIPNGADGLFEDGNGNSSTIGGTAAGARNVISGNLASGLELLGSNNLIEGNFVGTDGTGTKALGNQNWGMYVQGGSDDVIGGTAAGAGNVVAGNQFQGILVDSSKALVEGNFVGTDVTGSQAIPNLDSGLEVGGTYGGNTVGGTVAGARNVISGNAAGGLLINDASNALVEGNLIGTDITGTRSVANKGYGIEVSFSSFNTIGGTTPGAGNVISGNNGKGLLLYGTYFNGLSEPQVNSAANLVEGNLIGTDVTGANPLPNVSDGIAIQGSGNSGNTIGGTATGAGNVIAFNGGAGVGIASVTSSYPQDANIDNPIIGNAIDANGALGIDLGDDGVSPNNPAGSPEGANLLQPYPVITSAIDSATTTTVAATLAAQPSTTYTIEFFANPLADPSDFGQGQFDLGTEIVTTDATGHASFTFNTTSAHPGQALSATATDPLGNTSEFARDLLVGSATTTALTVPMSPVYIGQPLTLLATVSTISGAPTPTGDVAFTEDGQFLGSAALNTSGVASFTLSAPAGSHMFEEVYLGSPLSGGSISKPVVVTAVPQSSTTTLVTPISPEKFGQVLTFAARVDPTIGGVPTGLVYFGANSVILGTALLNASGVATFSTTSLPVGVSVIEAYYVGDASHSPSLSNFTQQKVVDVGPTVISEQVEASTKVKITFSQPLLASTAQDRTNYAITASHCDNLTILSAVYSSIDNSVTLTTRQALTPGKTYQLMINGVRKGRVEDINHLYLAGNLDKPGTNFVGKITPKPTKKHH